MPRSLLSKGLISWLFIRLQSEFSWDDFFEVYLSLCELTATWFSILSQSIGDITYLLIRLSNQTVNISPTNPLILNMRFKSVNYKTDKSVLDTRSYRSVIRLATSSSVLVSVQKIFIAKISSWEWNKHCLLSWQLEAQCHNLILDQALYTWRKVEFLHHLFMTEYLL